MQRCTFPLSVKCDISFSGKWETHRYEQCWAGRQDAHLATLEYDHTSCALVCKLLSTSPGSDRLIELCSFASVSAPSEHVCVNAY